MFSLFVNLMLAGLAPLLSSLIPRFVYRQGLSAKANYVMLGISAGLLFAIATLDLIPEAMEMARQGSAEVKGLDSEHNHDSNNKNGNDVTDAAHVRNLEENDERGNEEHDHGHSNDKEDGHDHEHGSGRLALLGLGCGYLVLLLVEQLMSSSGHTHSHGGGGAQLHVNEVDVEHEMGEAKEVSALIKQRIVFNQLL
jgi:zinc transporter ZupT